MGASGSVSGGGASASGFDLKVFGPFGAMFEPVFAGIAAEQRVAQGATNGEFAHIYSQQLKAAARCQLEGMALLNRRAQAYFDLPARFAGCRTPQDIVEQQGAFFTTALGQYSDSARRVMDIWSKAFSAGVEPFERARHDYINFESAAQAPVANEHGEHAEGRQQKRRVA